MDEYQGKSARPIWPESDQPCGRLVEQIADQEPAQLASPDLRITQAIGKRRGPFDLERNGLSAEAYRLRVRWRMDLQGGIQIPGCELPTCIGKAQHGGDRDFHAWGDLKSLLGTARDGTGCESRTDAGLAIGVAQAAYLEFTNRNEIGKRSASPDEACRIECNPKRAKGQSELATVQLYNRPVGSLERQGQSTIVQIVSGAQARIVRVRRWICFVRKQEGVCIDCRSEVICVLARALGVLKRHLRQCEDLVVAGGAVGDLCLKYGQSRLRVRREL